MSNFVFVDVHQRPRAEGYDLVGRGLCFQLYDAQAWIDGTRGVASAAVLHVLGKGGDAR